MCVCVFEACWWKIDFIIILHTQVQQKHNNKFLLPEFITGLWRVSACQKHSSENAWRFYQTLIQHLAWNILLCETIQTNSSDIFTLCSWRTPTAVNLFLEEKGKACLWNDKELDRSVKLSLLRAEECLTHTLKYLLLRFLLNDSNLRKHELCSSTWGSSTRA